MLRSVCRLQNVFRSSLSLVGKKGKQVFIILFDKCHCNKIGYKRFVDIINCISTGETA